MTERHRQAVLATIWLTLCLLAGAQVWGWIARGAVVTDLFALLPRSDTTVPTEALQRTFSEAEDQVVVLVGHSDRRLREAAARRIREVLSRPEIGLQPVETDTRRFAEAVAFYSRHRGDLLTPEQRATLASSAPETQVRRALVRLMQPFSVDLVRPWRDDPLGLAEGWFGAVAEASGFAALEPRWEVQWLRSTRGAFALDGDDALPRGLEEASAAAQDIAAGAEVLFAGVPLHAAAASAQATREISTIGLGSLLAVMLLVASAFKSLRPLLLVASTLLIGCLLGLWATLRLFGEVHVITLVFGASLVGVAEDYGIHYFAARQGDPAATPRQTLAAISPSLLLAWTTSALAYAVLGALPFPGLQQMAVFSAVGLAGAFLSVLVLFPCLDAAAPRRSGFADRVRASLQRIPTLGVGATFSLVAAVALVLAPAWSRLEVSDDLRQLQGSPASLVSMQQRVGAVLDLASPAQFFVVRADTAEALLERDAAVVDALRGFDDADLGGWLALSEWLPPESQRVAGRMLRAGLEARAVDAASALGAETQSATGVTPQPLELQHLHDSPLLRLLPGLWFGQDAGGWYSVVRLKGLHDASALGAFAAVAQRLPGVTWVDRTGEFSGLLGDYRVRMSWMVVLGHLLVAAALFARFGAQGWRAILPTTLASALTLAALAAIGEPIYLFNVLALLLLLGIGVDYGIFLFEHRDGAAWLAVVLGAASTLLAFGLLGLSATPALRAFGLTLLFGILAVWLLSPLLRPHTPAPQEPRLHAH